MIISLIKVRKQFELKCFKFSFWHSCCKIVFIPNNSYHPISSPQLIIKTKTEKMKFFTAIILFISLTFTTSATAQSFAEIVDYKKIVKLEMDIMKGFGTYQHTIFEAESYDNFIVDFQEIPVNLKSIKLLDADANIVYIENVSNLATDSLYELDLSKFTGSNYTLQLDSYTSTYFIDLSDR